MKRSTLNWVDWVSRAFGRQPARRRPRIHRALLLPECLEDRSLLSAAASMSSGRWIINADIDNAQLAEVIVVEPSPDDARRLRVVINGLTLDDRAARRVKSITINAGDGNDTVTVQLPESLSRIVVTVNGGDGDDVLNAGGNRGVLRGGNGNDILNGSASVDQLFGGRGDDILNGNGGDDLLQGDDGEDTLVGGLGADRLRGGGGKDWIYSSLGIDSVVSDSADVVTAEQAVGLQHFETEAAFFDWLSHSDTVNQKLGYGSIFSTSGGPLMDAVRGDEGTAAEGSHSDTNTQVAGVDEQDIVETDGDFIYTVRGNELLIIDVRQAAEAEVISRTQLAGWGAEMYLDGDRLTVISSVNRFWEIYPADIVEPTIATSSLRLWPGWDWHPRTQVTTYDITDRSNIKVLEDTTLDGSVTTSRSVDGRIYLVVNNNLWSRFYPPWYDVITTNVDTVSVSGASVGKLSVPPIDFDWTEFVPHYTTRSYDASGDVTVVTGSLLDAPNIWATEDSFRNSNLLTIAMFDIDVGPAGVDSTSSVYGLSGEIYSSEEALYVAAVNYNFEIMPVWTNSFAPSSGPFTTLYKFDLNTDGSKLVATGKVDGTIINQFAMDEHDGYFRIATTSGSWGTTPSSNVFVLEQQGDNLVVVSSLTGLSPTERIQSARFIGEHLYLSTFLRIDPLLAIDLSDPLTPVVTGELEVPGFSSYLQQWGDHFLVSIGQDADPETGMVTGLQLSLFDTSGDAPTLVDTYRLSVSAWDTYSQAQWNHHAFSLFDAEGILAIPVSRWDATTGYSSQLDVFQLNAETGFKLLGAVEHDSEVLRSLRIGDELFSLSDSALKINVLLDPETEVGEVALANPNLPDPDPTDPPIVILAVDE